MEIFDVFSMNGIKNYPAAGEKKKNILKTHRHTFPRISTPRGGGHRFFKGGNAPLRGGGGCEVP